MGDEVKHGTGGRPWACYYYSEDHDRAAEHILRNSLEVCEWIKGTTGRPSDDPQMHYLLQMSAKEVLPEANLVDLGNVALALRQKIHPMNEEDLKLVADLKRRSDIFAKDRGY